jgi:alkanesulfonate monooxygenase SsuD/methylene tetrahydromethanopterin reductase-like flavin-dependent oxidoreductase (luciferase family)
MYIDLRNPPEWRRPWDRFYGRWLERTQEAERLGASSVWLSEHHFFDDGYLPQCWTFAAAIAARTTTLRIGTGICILPLHDPLELAEQIAVADVISGGRIEPGFGLGYRKPEYLAFKGNFKRRYGEYAERVSALRAYWGELPGPEQLSTGQLSTGQLGQCAPLPPRRSSVRSRCGAASTGRRARPSPAGSGCPCSR